jgi:hypothetical protein
MKNCELVFRRIGFMQDFCDVRFRKCLYKVCRGDNHKRYLDNKKCKLKVKNNFKNFSS